MSAIWRYKPHVSADPSPPQETSLLPRMSICGTGVLRSQETSAPRSPEVPRHSATAGSYGVVFRMRKGTLERLPGRYDAPESRVVVCSLVLEASNIGGHRQLFCKKAMLHFGQNQAPLYRTSLECTFAPLLSLFAHNLTHGPAPMCGGRVGMMKEGLPLRHRGYA